MDITVVHWIYINTFFYTVTRYMTEGAYSRKNQRTNHDKSSYFKTVEIKTPLIYDQ